MTSTLYAKMAAANGRPSGFDYLRLGMSVAIVVMHSGITSYGEVTDVVLWNSPLQGVARLVLPMFFSMSGFLVGGSLLRCKTLVMFVGLRAIRIYPALAVEVLLSSLLIGPIVTTYNLADYFLSTEFLKYVFNITGHIHYTLPGVFKDNPFPKVVNAQLWTVPFELYCYLTLTIVGILGIKKRFYIAPLTVFAVSAFHFASQYSRNGLEAEVIVKAIPGPMLIAYAFGGLTMFLYRNKIPASRFHMLVATLVSLIVVQLPFGEYLALFPSCYLMALIGLSNPRRIFLIKGADYSYGIFLYGFVIQQTVMHVVPCLREWYFNILVSLPLSAAFAAASWHFVERPCLEHKDQLVKLEQAWLRLRGRLPIPGWRELRFTRPSLIDE